MASNSRQQTNFYFRKLVLRFLDRTPARTLSEQPVQQFVGDDIDTPLHCQQLIDIRADDDYHHYHAVPAAAAAVSRRAVSMYTNIELNRGYMWNKTLK